MSRHLALGAVGFTVSCLLAWPAIASDDVQVGPGQGSFNGAVEAQVSESTPTNDGHTTGLADVPTHEESKPACAVGGGQICQDEQLTCPDGSDMAVVWDVATDGTRSNFRYDCPSDPRAPNPGPSPADVLRAFRQIPLPGSVLNIEPPGGATLVNLMTSA